MVVRRWLSRSDRMVVVRLLLASGRGWTAAVVLFVAASAIVPNLVLVSVGFMIGQVPGATRDGLSSASGHALLIALAVAGAAYAVAVLLGPIQTALSTSLKWQTHLLDAGQVDVRRLEACRHRAPRATPDARSTCPRSRAVDQLLPRGRRDDPGDGRKQPDRRPPRVHRGGQLSLVARRRHARHLARDPPPAGRDHHGPGQDLQRER